MRVALIITTYERLDALAAVLDSVARQRMPPAELVVADDGSGPETRALVEGFGRLSRIATRFVWQSHEGFRLSRLRNLAIAATLMEYLVFIDGDMLLHPDFLADHSRIARRGFFTQGVRARADETLTRRLIARPAAGVRPWTRGLGGLRRAYLLRSRAAMSLMRRAGAAFVSIKGCNQGYFRDDLVRANGFNEAIVGWGPEDKELAARLRNAGVRRQTLLFGGIACHLHHPPASRSSLPANLAVFEATRREGALRCELGLDSHLDI